MRPVRALAFLGKTLNSSYSCWSTREAMAMLKKMPEWMQTSIILFGGLIWITVLFLLASWIGGVPLF